MIKSAFVVLVCVTIHNKWTIPFSGTIQNEQAPGGYPIETSYQFATGKSTFALLHF